MKTKNMLSMIAVVAGLAAVDAMAKTEFAVGTFTVPKASAEGYLKESDLPTALAEADNVTAIKTAVATEGYLKTIPAEYLKSTDSAFTDVQSKADAALPAADLATELAKTANANAIKTAVATEGYLKTVPSDVVRTNDISDVVRTGTLASTMGVTPGENQTIGQKLAADMASAASTAASGAVNNIDATFLAGKGGITTGNLTDKLTAANVVTSDTLASAMGVTLGENQTIGQKLAADMASAVETATEGMVTDKDIAGIITDNGIITSSDLASALVNVVTAAKSSCSGEAETVECSNNLGKALFEPVQ